MSNHNVEGRLKELEQGALLSSQTLKEYEKMQQRVLDTLQKIHEALVGQVDIQSSGLIEEVRNLKRGHESLLALLNQTKADVHAVQDEIRQIKEVKLRAVDRKSNHIIELIKKYKYMAIGGGAVILFLGKHLVEFAINNYSKLIKMFFP